jgi:hypothetical protein
LLYFNFLTVDLVLQLVLCIVTVVQPDELVLLSIEKEMLNKFDYDNLINVFCELKSQKIKFK